MPDAPTGQPAGQPAGRPGGGRVTRLATAPQYTAPLHHAVSTLRLQGHEAGPTERFWVGLSYYLPAGRADRAPTREETVYLVLDGEFAVTAGGRTDILGPHDSIHLPKGTEREVENRTNRPATLLVIIATPAEKPQ
jgi:mannose-6-phosphate isomerase-like protein (cupin superfamily)